ALYRNARIMILDEPTAVLGDNDVERLLQIVTSLKQRGIAVIFISHRLNEIFGLADKYWVLRDWRQTMEGRIDETNPDELVEKMGGRHIQYTPTEVTHDRNLEMLRVEGLSRTGIIKNIIFSLYKGEILGIAGLRGAGRTEVA